MKSRKAGLALSVVAIAAAASRFVALRDDGSGRPQSAEPEADGGSAADRRVQRAAREDRSDLPPKIVVRNGEPVGGVLDPVFSRGGRIDLVVASDVAEEVHLHGYDVSKPIEAGGQVRFSLPANIEGVFELELEGSAVPIAEISVEPS